MIFTVILFVSAGQNNIYKVVSLNQIPKILFGTVLQYVGNCKAGNIVADIFGSSLCVNAKPPTSRCYVMTDSSELEIYRSHHASYILTIVIMLYDGLKDTLDRPKYYNLLKFGRNI